MFKKGKSELNSCLLQGNVPFSIMPLKKTEKVSLEILRKPKKNEIEANSEKLKKLQAFDLSKQLKEIDENPKFMSKEKIQPKNSLVKDKDEIGLAQKLKDKSNLINEEMAAMKYLSLVMQNDEKKQFQQNILMQRTALELQQRKNYSETIKILEKSKKIESEFYADHHKKMFFPVNEESKTDYLKSISEKHLKSDQLLELKSVKNIKERENDIKKWIEKGIKEENTKLFKKIEEEKQKKSTNSIILRNSLEQQFSLKNKLREKISTDEKALNRSVKKPKNSEGKDPKKKMMSKKKLYLSELVISTDNSRSSYIRKMNTNENSEIKSPYTQEENNFRYPSSGNRYLSRVGEIVSNISPKTSRLLTLN